MRILWALTSARREVLDGASRAVVYTDFLTIDLFHTYDFSSQGTIRILSTVVVSWLVAVMVMCFHEESWLALVTSEVDLVPWTRESLAVITVSAELFVRSILALRHLVAASHQLNESWLAPLTRHRVSSTSSSIVDLVDTDSTVVEVLLTSRGSGGVGSSIGWVDHWFLWTGDEVSLS